MVLMQTINYLYVLQMSHRVTSRLERPLSYNVPWRRTQDSNLQGVSAQLLSRQRPHHSDTRHIQRLYLSKTIKLSVKMEWTLPSQHVFSYAPKVLYIHKVFLEISEHILVSHIILIDLPALCRHRKLASFSGYWMTRTSNSRQQTIVFPIKLSTHMRWGFRPYD